MNNATSFMVGQKVRLTGYGRVTRYQGRAKTAYGRVVGVDESRNRIEVKRYGIKTVRAYSPYGWESVVKAAQ